MGPAPLPSVEFCLFTPAEDVATWSSELTPESSVARWCLFSFSLSPPFPTFLLVFRACSSCRPVGSWRFPLLMLCPPFTKSPLGRTQTQERSGSGETLKLAVFQRVHNQGSVSEVTHPLLRCCVRSAAVTDFGVLCLHCRGHSLGTGEVYN